MVRTSTMVLNGNLTVQMNQTILQNRKQRKNGHVNGEKRVRRWCVFGN
jgi:hypothetical protein